MFCSKCGTKLEEGAKFCPECGATVENQKSGNTIEGVSGVYVDNTTPPVENVVTKTNGVNNKSIRNIIIGVVIVAVIGFFGYKFLLGGSSSSYEAPIETLVTGIEDKDIDAIFSVIPFTSISSSLLAFFILLTLPKCFNSAFFFTSPIPFISSNSDFVIAFSLNFL